MSTIAEQIDAMLEKVVIIGRVQSEGFPENALFKEIRELLLSIPVDSEEWEKQVTFHRGRMAEMKLSLGHMAAFANAIPRGFKQWSLMTLSDGRAVSVAEVAVHLNRLPAFFSDWEISDEEGWSVAHAAASVGKLPSWFSHWDLKTKSGISVRDVHDKNHERLTK